VFTEKIQSILYTRVTKFQKLYPVLCNMLQIGGLGRLNILFTK